MQVRLILCGSDFHVHFGVMPAPILLKRVPLKKREYNHKNNFPGINFPAGISLLLGPPIKSAILCLAKSSAPARWEENGWTSSSKDDNNTAASKSWETARPKPIPIGTTRSDMTRQASNQSCNDSLMPGISEMLLLMEESENRVLSVWQRFHRGSPPWGYREWQRGYLFKMQR